MDICAGGFLAGGVLAGGYSAGGFLAGGYSACGYLAGGYSAEVFLVGGYSAGGVLAGGYSAIFRYKSASVAQRFQNQNKMHDIKNPIWNKFFKPAISYLKFLRRLPFF